MKTKSVPNAHGTEKMGCTTYVDLFPTSSLVRALGKESCSTIGALPIDRMSTLLFAICEFRCSKSTDPSRVRRYVVRSLDTKLSLCLPILLPNAV